MITRRGALATSLLASLPGLTQAQSAQVVVGTWGGDYGDLLAGNIDKPLLAPRGTGRRVPDWRSRAAWPGEHGADQPFDPCPGVRWALLHDGAASGNRHPGSTLDACFLAWSRAAEDPLALTRFRTARPPLPEPDLKVSLHPARPPRI